MKQVVYVDVLLAVNILINFLLLLSASFILKADVKRWRLLCGAALGGVYSLVIFLPQVATPVSVAIKLAFSVSIIFASFKIPTLKAFLRYFAAFFAVNFAFAGIMLALWIAFKPKGMIFNNGAVYFDINILTLSLTAVICYVVVSIISKLFRRNAPDSHLYTVEILVFDKSIIGKALLDTGNALKESFSGFPVIIAEYSFLKPLFPPELRGFFETGAEAITEAVPQWGNRLRLVPYNSVKDRGVLPAFRPDFVKITGTKGSFEIQDVYIAASQRILADGEYRALLGVELFKNYGIEKGGKLHAQAVKHN